MLSGDSRLVKFRNSFKNDKRISVFYDYENEAEFFRGVHIDGGICYFLWDTKHDGKAKTYHILASGFKQHYIRFLYNNFSNYVIRDLRILSILEKCKTEKSFSSIVSALSPYGIETGLFNKPEEYPEAQLSQEYNDGKVKIFGVYGYKGGARRTSGDISPNFIQRKQTNLEKWKIFFSATYSTNATEPPAIIPSRPKEAYTATFLEIGPFNSVEERDNCIAYINTYLFKFLLYHGHGTIHVTRNVFSYIPLLKFNEGWDNEKVYSSFGLNEDEIKFIEDTISKKR